LIAVLFWSTEVIFAKKFLKNIDPKILAAGRMFFGGIIMIGYLFLTNQAKFILQNNSSQWFWIFVTSAFLLGYVTFWFSALKNAPATLVTCILTLGLPITTILESFFINRALSNLKFEGIMFSIIAVLFLLIYYYRPDWFYFKLKKT
jgi:drug/metabolite transporter (DMT)-like permease